ncbi:hypothetical protein GC173_12930 [bacterium]|nr:hypothetical protein [bacterium]
MKPARQWSCLRAALLAGLALATAGCTTLKVESNPPGARVLWSADGKSNWQPWPPRAWKANADVDSTVTPLRAKGTFGDTVFVTVQKDGYWRPLPKPVELYFGRSSTLRFTLEELPEVRAARLRAEGYVLFRGDWIKPEEYGLVEYKGEILPRDEAFRREQLDKGLVLYNDVWMTAAEKDERFAADMAAKGLVEFKGRWIEAAEQTKEAAVDAEVAAIAKDKAYPDLPIPRVSGSSQRDKSQLQLSNSTGQLVRVLISGPRSLEIELPPYGSAGVKSGDPLVVPAGTYQFAIVPTGRDAAGRDLTQLLGRVDSDSAITLSTTPLWGTWPMATGQQYSFNYTGSDNNLKENLREFTPPEPKLDFTPPSIEIPEPELPKQPEQTRRPGGEGAPNGERRSGGRPGGSGRAR